MPKFVFRQTPQQTGPLSGMFIGRERHVADFRASVSYLLQKAVKPTGDFYSHLFIAYGEGGMGKTTLLNRWLDVAREEGMLSEHIIMVDLDYTSYPSPYDLAQAIIAGLCRSFPAFDQRYRNVQSRRQLLKDRYDEIRIQWDRWQSHSASGTADELLRTWRTQLTSTEIKQAKFGTLHAPTMLTFEVEGAQRELQALRGFIDAKGHSPQTLSELLEQELGADAALFEHRTSAHALGNDIYELAEQHPLILALDTYELADRHHDWLVELFLEAGDQLLLLLGGRNAIHKTDYHERRFGGDLRPLVQAYDLGNDTFSSAEIRQFVSQSLGHKSNDDDIVRIEQISRGVPLAVEALSGALKESGGLWMFDDLDTRAHEHNAIVRTVINRFMRYAVEDSKRDSAEDTLRKQADRTDIRGLALMMRPDPELVCRLWNCDDHTVETRISDLSSRHSFIFVRCGSFEMHDLVRLFIREDLWHTKAAQFEWPRLRAGLSRCLILVNSRLGQYSTLTHEDAYATAEFRQAVVDRFNLLLWLDNLDEAQHWLLNRWLEARYYHRALAEDLEILLHELTPPNRTWRTLHELLGLGSMRKFPQVSRKDQEPDAAQQHTSTTMRPAFAAFESYRYLLEPHAHMLYFYLWATHDMASSISSEEELQRVNQNIMLLERSQQYDPAFMPNAVMLARALSVRGRYHMSQERSSHLAIEDFNRAIELDPTSTLPFRNRAIVTVDIYGYAAAMADVDRIIELDPTDTWGFAVRGFLKSTFESYASAIADFDRAIELDPTMTAVFTARGRAKAKLGEHVAAMADYDRAIELDPTSAFSLHSRADLKRQLGDDTAAMADYDRAIEFDPTSSFYLHSRADLKRQLGDDIAAMADYDRAIEIDASVASNFDSRADFKRQLGDYAAAITDYDRAIELDPTDVQAFTTRGLTKASLGDYVAAIADLDHAIELDPTDAWRFTIRGRIKRQLRDYVAAITDYDRAIELDPTDVHAFTARGLTKATLGDYAAAIADLDRAIELDPTDAWGFGIRGAAKASLGDYVAAIADYDRAIELDPNNASVFNHRGYVKRKRQDYAAAIADFDHAIELDPTNASAFNHRGGSKAELGEHTAAIADFDHAIKLNPNDVLSFHNRGISKAKHGNHAAAIADFDHAIELDPTNASAFNHRGGSKAELGEHTAAIADFDHAIELDPNNALFFYNRGFVKRKLQDYAAAMTDYDHAIELDPTSAILLNSRGHFKMKIGNIVEAREDIERAIMLSPDYFYALCSMAELYIVLGEFDQAFAYMEQATTLDPAARQVIRESDDYALVREDPRFRMLAGE